MLKKQILLNLLIISTLSFKTFAQGIGNSPYSAIGVGEIVQGGFAESYGLGGSGVSFSNGFSINGINPAMLAKNHLTVFDVGLLGNSKKIDDGTTSQHDFGMSLNYLAIAFPIRPKITSGLIFQPYSIIDNESRYLKTIDGTANTVQYIYKSLGGISKLSWSNGFQIGKSLYLGFDAIYYLGSMQRDTTTQLQLGDGQDYFLKYSDVTSYNGVGLKAGFAYQQKLSENWQFNIGGTYEFQSTLKGHGIRSFSTLVQSTNGPTLVKSPDTLSLSRGHLTLPDRYTVGISLESPFKWYFTADYTVQHWSKFVNYSGQSDPNLTDGHTFSAGIEYLPKTSGTKYFNHVSYRIGYQSSQTPQTVNGVQISDQHVSMGLSMPLGRNAPTWANIAVVLGKKGTIGNGLIQENYTRIVLGFSINQQWFQKVKID